MVDMAEIVTAMVEADVRREWKVVEVAEVEVTVTVEVAEVEVIVLARVLQEGLHTEHNKWPHLCCSDKVAGGL